LAGVTRVKVCGITRPEDAELAVELGAWALGFILWEPSPRAADPDTVAGIVAAYRRQVETVGVFVDPTLDEVAGAVDALHLSMVQLHGGVGPQFATEVARRTGARVIRAFRIGASADVQDADRYRHVDFHLFDARVPGLQGGSGATWDWELARRRRAKVPLILSGGLTAGNLGEGIAALDPYAVDVASGVEASPGVKDPAKVRAFLDAAGATAGARA
jgi:phosphoribosylanthranilate isomerase